MVELIRIPTLLASTAVALLALLVLWLRFRDRVHRALSLFLLFRALLYGLVSFSQGQNLASGLAPYAAIAIPFAGLNFAAVFWERYSQPGRGPTPQQITLARWALLITAAAFEILYLLNHDLWFAPQPEAPLILFQPLTYLTYALVAALLVWAYRDPHPEHRRRGLFLLGVGFAVEPAYWGTYATLELGIRPAQGLILLTHDLLYAATPAVLLAGLAVLAWRAQPSQTRAEATRYGASLLVPAACGAIVYTVGRLASQDTFLLALFTGDAFFHLALVLLIVYALLRYEVFGLEPKVKFAVERGTMGAAFGGMVFLISEILEIFLPVEGDMMGLLGAILIAVTLHPFRRFGVEVADRIMPDVQDTHEYKQRRKREIYKTAIERALDDDGKISPREATILESLREDLDIDEATHDTLRDEIRTARQSALEPAEAPGSLGTAPSPNKRPDG